MAVLAQLRGFVRAFRRSPGTMRTHHGHSLARALKESTHVRGNRGGLPRASTEAHHKIVAEGHEQYSRSFDGGD